MKDFTIAVATTALNILDGTHHATNWNALQAAWDSEGMGFVEFCMWSSEIAFEANDRLQTAHDVRDVHDLEFPGVYDYEVSYDIGSEILGYVLSHGALPPMDVWKQWLTDKSAAFFKQG